MTSDLIFQGEKPVLSGIHELDPLQDSRWSDFVRNHPQASVFHTTEWLTALRSAYGYEPAVVCTFTPGQLIKSAIVFCRIRSWLTGNRIVSLPFSDHCEPLVDSSGELDDLLLHLRRTVEQSRWDYVEVRPSIHEPGRSTGLEPFLKYAWHVVPLSGSSDSLFRSFHKDCVQRKIRRAERESLTCESGNTLALLTEFFRLLVMTRKRQALPPQPFAWFRHLSGAFGERLQVRVASHRGRAVASILTLKHGQTIYYKYGCSDTRFNNLGGTQLLFWKTIEEAKREGFTQFDLGRSDLSNPGLIAFKEHWAATRATLNYWTFPPRPPSEGRAWSKKLMETSVAVAPDWSLIAIGKLLYRHIG